MPPTKTPTFSLSTLKLRPIRRRHLRKYSWLPDVLRLKGSVIGHIIGPVLTVTIFAAVVAFLWSKGYALRLTNSVLPLLSVVVGLILVFRNGTSYDRYWEGRKSFATLTSNIRSLSRVIWVQVALPPTDEETFLAAKGKAVTSELTPGQVRVQKIEALQYCLAFAYAVKHYVRGEDGIHHEDFSGVLPLSFASRINVEGSRRHSPDYGSLSGGGSEEGKSSSSFLAGATKRVKPKRSKRNMVPNTPQVSGSNTPLLNGPHQSIEFCRPAEDLTMPLPLMIAHELSSAIFRFRRDSLLETVGPAGANAMSGMVSSMVDQMTAMERVANTPIPVSYAIHLKQCVTLYLFALPFTLINDLGWAIVPIITVVAFTLMGIEGIADQIEMPFGHDKHDLPLDTYCDDLREEIAYMIEKLPEGGHGVQSYDDGEGDD